MATSITKNGAPAEPRRRGTSPSSDRGIPARKGSTPSSEKSVPSYLRPTASSRGDVPKETRKKPALLSPDNRKAALGRRSSFDRPPSASQLQKIISTSPGGRSITVRSSSFSGRTGAVHNRPASERTTSVAPSRTAKAAQRTQPVSSVGGRAGAKKTGSTVSGRPSLAAKNKEKPVDAPAVVVHDDESGDDNSGMIAKADGEKLASPVGEEAEEVPEPVQAENIVVEDKVPEVVVSEEELKNGVSHVENDLEDKEEISVDNGAVPASKEEEEDKNFTVKAPPQVEEVHKEIEDKEEEITSDDPKGEEEEAEVPEAILELVEAEDKPVAEAVDVAAQEETESGDGAKDPDIATPGSNEPDKVKESEAVDAEDEKQALPETVQQRMEKPAAAAAPPAAKKDPAQANNDIIEETTKKLMESSRRNKVKALAGAFETVISLEKPGQA